MGVAAELDPRPGGIFRLDPNGSGSDAISGTFVEVTPPTRIVFTWGYASPGHRLPPGSTTVEIDLIPQAGGGTLLRHGTPGVRRRTRRATRAAGSTTWRAWRSGWLDATGPRCASHWGPPLRVSEPP